MDRVISIIDRILLFILLLVFVLLLGLLSAQVVLRYIFSNPIMGVEEYSNILFTVLSFVGCAFVARDDEDLKVDFFHNRFPEKVKTFLNLIFKICPLLILIYLRSYFSDYMMIQSGIMVPGKLFPLLYYTYAFIIGFSLMAFYYIIPASGDPVESIFDKK